MVEGTRTAQGKWLDCNRMALAMDSDVSFPWCTYINQAGLCLQACANTSWLLMEVNDWQRAMALLVQGPCRSGQDLPIHRLACRFFMCPESRATSFRAAGQKVFFGSALASTGKKGSCMSDTWYGVIRKLLVWSAKCLCHVSWLLWSQDAWLLKCMGNWYTDLGHYKEARRSHVTGIICLGQTTCVKKQSEYQYMIHDMIFKKTHIHTHICL